MASNAVQNLYIAHNTSPNNYNPPNNLFLASYLTSSQLNRGRVVGPAPTPLSNDSSLTCAPAQASSIVGNAVQNLYVAHNTSPNNYNPPVSNPTTFLTSYLTSSQLNRGCIVGSTSTRLSNDSSLTCAPAPSSGSKSLTKSHKWSRTDAKIQSEQSGADSDADSQHSLAQLDKWLKQHINDGGRAIMQWYLWL
jgi:hypothetical protein